MISFKKLINTYKQLNREIKTTVIFFKVLTKGSPPRS